MFPSNDAEEDALLFEDRERVFGSDVADAMLLAQSLDAWHAAGRRAVLDLTAQQRTALRPG